MSNEQIKYSIIGVYLLGCVIGYWFVKKDFTVKILWQYGGSFGFWDYFFIFLFSSFSWVTVAVGLLMSTQWKYYKEVKR